VGQFEVFVFQYFSEDVQAIIIIIIIIIIMPGIEVRIFCGKKI